MPGSKKDRKNGKESGGVVAAVTRHHGVKFTNCDVTGTSLSASPSPPHRSVLPDTMPGPPVQSPAPPPTAGLVGNDFMAPSPLLDAISTTSFATSNSPNTREWASGIAAGMAGSPGNLISLSGRSPSTGPSSYEDTRALSSGWSSPRPGAPYQPPAPSVSPPTATRRPLSYHMDANTHFSGAADLSSQAASVAPRRSSMQSHFAQIRISPNPPLPHQPQQHFYTAPEIDLDLHTHSGMLAGEKGYFFGFDSLPLPNGDAGPGRDSVAVAGYEGGLEVHLVGKRGMDHVASLKGLRGGVYNAKILPWTSSGAHGSPLIALVIHGPCLPPPAPGIHVENDYDPVSADRSEAMASGSGSGSDAPVRDGGASARAGPGFVEAYQTTVEVYSLKTGKLVEVLLEAPKIPLKTPITSPVFQPPAPTGAFQIKADAGNMVVASGVTGECWLFRQLVDPAHGDAHFFSMGKAWTTLQQPPKGPSTPELDRGRMAASPRPRTRPQSAIFGLRGTLFVYCPAAPSSQIALRASVAVASQGKAPGLMSPTPPQLPVINSELDLPVSESVMNKIMRDATQELIQGAKWVGKQGWQAWNNYWNPQPPTQTPRSPTLQAQAQAQAWGGLPGARNEASQFPPTHGSVTPPPTPKEPGLVSILDLETLGASSSSVHPLTTFQLSNGCSYVSLSPTGLFLFTASTKGDVQTVWDLMRIQYTKSSPLQPALSITGPRVRQVAQFSRMTVARVVDVAWTKPNGERAAMVTERGTVHLLDLPSSAFTWPPPRRRSRPQEKPSITAEGNPSAVSIASTALSSVRDAARPLMARPRRSISNVPQQAGAGLGDYATHGGKVIAASISHSLGRTGNAINQLRHTGENRFSLPSSANAPGVSCVTWITGRRDHHLFVLGAGLVRTFATKSRKASAGSNKRASRMSRYMDYKMACLPDDTLAPAVKKIIDPDEYLDFAERDSDAGGGNMHPVLQQRARSTPSASTGIDSSIPQAEIESSAPYQPFHTDRRVALFELGGAPWPVEAAVDKHTKPNVIPPAIPLMMLPGNVNEDITGVPTMRGRSRRPDAARMLAAKSTSQKVAVFDEAGGDWGLASGGAWVFGQPIQATRLDVGLPRPSMEEEPFDAASLGTDDSRSLPPSAMERVLHRYGDGHANEDQIVVTTRRRRGAGEPGHGPNLDDDGFFEDDCEVLDFADQRV